MQLLNAKRGEITIETIMSVLRDHGQADGSQRSADEGLAGADVCMHASFGPIRISQTTGSMVSFLDQKSPLHFVTGTAAPCTSIFKPVWIDAFSPDNFPPPITSIGPNPNEIYNPETLFWRHEVLHRTTLRDHTNCIQTFAFNRDALEREFVSDAFGAQIKNAKSRADVTAKCFSRASAAEKDWLGRIQEEPSRENWLYASAWGEFNREAGLSVEMKNKLG